MILSLYFFIIIHNFVQSCFFSILITTDCKACVPNFLYFDCNHVKRDGNRSAHAFAKYGTLIDTEEVWIEDSPSWASSQLRDDMLNSY